MLNNPQDPSRDVSARYEETAREHGLFVPQSIIPMVI